jgi:NADH:ubiquinone oxidoreductase subunit F (NADH-binding)
MSIAEIERAGLTGRGGGGFPTGRKLALVAGARQPVVVANGTEGEPTSLKDKTLLRCSPHLVFDGISIAADLLGADVAILCVERDAHAVTQAVQRAAAERAAARLDRVEIRIAAAPSRYVGGEESALVHWLNGGEARPTFVPPRPTERGVWGRPTLLDNVETLAHLALIVRFGARWFRSLGTPEEPGTALVTVAGGGIPPRVYETPYGVPLVEILAAAGAGPMTHSLLLGGYAGGWITAEAASRLTFDRRSLATVGATIGCASLLVLDERSCGLDATARIAAWMAGQNAGQCGPCTNGLPAIAAALDGLVAGDERMGHEDHVRRWVEQVDGRGACHHPDGVARMVRSALKVFADEITAHRQRGPCPAPASDLPLPARQGPWR